MWVPEDHESKRGPTTRGEMQIFECQTIARKEVVWEATARGRATGLEKKGLVFLHPVEFL